MQSGLTRRGFLRSTALAAASTWLGGSALGGESAPLKIGIRAASMKMTGTPEVFQVAATVPGLRGVELQATAGEPDLRDPATARRYKAEAERWGIEIPSLAGIWDRGVKIGSAGAADSILASIRAAEMLGAGVILAAFFRQDAPVMTDEASYGPIVAMLQKVAPKAADAGVVIGLENSLSPADNRKLVDLVGHRAVGVYYDAHNMDFYGHGKDAVTGIELLGKSRIAMVHVKNGADLLEQPGPIDWVAALAALRRIGYEGWYVYESSHGSTADCVEDTKKNNLFLQRQIRL